jgi:hypothetical protein
MLTANRQPYWTFTVYQYPNAYNDKRENDYEVLARTMSRLYGTIQTL